MSAGHVFLEVCVGCGHEITFFTISDLMRILEMLLKNLDSLELLLTVVTLFLFPRVHPRLVLGEMCLSYNKLDLIHVNFFFVPLFP